ncbi:MAG: hypothetical protein A2798_03070 [Candidatus Levybacteria bacterium RIFCSPHIGHO2_01_FULL_37_17]|nr:MAG: hypothetical protein A2798_03070 [Candidatus Levybacteria bacterium RIFCSPHIGHO2_01_FULL_37_17]OGH36836.1 MAG: hypothetical protein A2959_01060 [Candidatus Levybacteria bacterium RIFCSPLOWO2_01_FULL_38_23]
MGARTKILLITFAFLFFFFFGINSVYAQSPDLQKQVDELKERIASKVAELNLVEKKAILGTVKDVSDSQMTLSTLNEEIRFIDIDELTKFSSGTIDNFGISDIKQDMTIGVIGLFNKDSRRTQARLVYEEQKLPTIIYGAVYAIDAENFNITVAKENGAKNIVEIETITKTSSFEDGSLVKAGFSKIKEGQTIIAIGVLDIANKNKIVASRVLLFPEIAVSSKINLDKNIPTIPASTGSGVKVQPIIK